MAKLTYDQIVLVDGRPPISLSKRNPFKVYAQFTTVDPEIFDPMDLRELLQNISKEIDVMLIHKAEPDKWHLYQVWIAAPMYIMDELKRTCVEARKIVKSMNMSFYATKCKHMMEPSLQGMTATSKTAYEELTKKIGIIDSVTSEYMLSVSSEEVKKIIEVMFTTGHTMCEIIDHETNFGFGFALGGSDADRIYFRLLNENIWGVDIYASTTYCHFIKVVEIALPGNGVVSKCVKSHMASNDSYSRCENVQKYIQECIKKNCEQRMAFSVATVTQIQQHKMQELFDHGIRYAYFDDEQTCLNRIKVFINFIIEKYSDNVDVSIDLIRALEKYMITIKYTDDIYTRFVPQDGDKWSIEIFSPDMIALYSTAAGKSISELFPQWYNQGEDDPKKPENTESSSLSDSDKV